LNDIVIVTNAAGELSAWVKPICESLIKLWPESQVTIVLTPSQFLTGSEVEYASKLPGVNKVIPVCDFWNILRKGIGFKSKQGVILSLGGHLLYPVMLKWRLGYSAYAYVEKRIQWRKQYQHFFTRDEVGDLMVDSLPPKSPLEVTEAEAPGCTVALLPGSRSYHLQFMVPFMQEVADLVLQTYPELNFVWKVSPFAQEEQFKSSLNNFSLQRDFDNIDLALTIPGTNTAQLAICGIPMVSIMPLNWPENIPLEGLLEYVCKLPLIGSSLRRYAFKLFEKHRRSLALPNILSKQVIVPELLGVLTPEQVAESLIALLKDMTARELMSKDLQKIMGPRGAAEQIINSIRQSLIYHR